MLKVSTAKMMWSLTTICFTGFTLQVVCYGSTFSPVLSPLGDNVYIADTPTSSTSGLSLAGCASQCMFFSALNGGSLSVCRCFNYNFSNAYCSVFAFQPTAVNVTNLNGSAKAYQTSDGFVSALFPTVSRRQCMFPFEHNGQKSYDCIYSNHPNSVGQFGCVLTNNQQAFCNPQSARGLLLTNIITGQNYYVSALAQHNDELFVLRVNGTSGQSQVAVFNTTTFQPMRYSNLFNGWSNGLAVDPTKNRLYVANGTYDKIHAWDLNTFQEAPGSPWPVPYFTYALSMNSAQNILVSSSNAVIYEYNSSGAQVRNTTAGDGIGVFQAVEVNDGMLVSSTLLSPLYGVRLLAVNGTVLRRYAAGKVIYARGLAVDKQGFALVADYANNIIYALDPTLTASSNLSIPLDTADKIVRPWSLWYDESRGRLYVGEYRTAGRVLVFDNLLSISDVLQP